MDEGDERGPFRSGVTGAGQRSGSGGLDEEAGAGRRCGMASRDTPSDKGPIDPIVAEFRRDKAREEGTYRARALKLLPHVCGHCGRVFEGRRLRELTVHHKDHDPMNNPPDGSNWELLCLYCHDNEHNRNSVAVALTGDAPGTEREPGGLQQPFAGLADLLKEKNKGKHGE
jgi:hypothetical protein